MLTPFTEKDILNVYKKRYLPFAPLQIRALLHDINRIFGKYSREDQLKIACMCAPPMFFNLHGLLIAHPYGITLSANRVGCDCSIGQNATIGTDGQFPLEETTRGHTPSIGNLVRIYAGTIISGKISIGNYSIIAGGAIVTKDVPSKSIVYGVNQVVPLQERHYIILERLIQQCDKLYVWVPGLMYQDERLYINSDYLEIRKELIKHVGTHSFRDCLKNLD